MILTFLITIITGAFCDSTASALYSQAKYSEAIAWAEKGVTISAKEGNEDDRLNCMSVLSATYTRLGDFDKALDYAIDIYEADGKDGDPENLSHDLHSMAVIYHLSGRTDTAMEYITRSIDYARKAGKSYRSCLAVRLGNAADIFRNAGRVQEAIKFAEEARAIDLADGRKDKAAVRLCQLAGCLAAAGNTEEAIGKYRESLKTLRESNLKESLCIGCRELAAIIPEGAEARSLLEEAYSIAKETGNRKSLMECCNSLATQYKEVNPQKSIAFLEEALTLKDEIARMSDSEQAERFNAQFKVKEQSFLLHKEKARLKATITIAVLLLLILFLMILFLNDMISSRKSLMKSNMEIKENLRFALEQIDNLKSAPIPAEGLPNFTNRELDIIRLASKGKIAKEIADELGISAKTVDNIKAGIFQKMGVSTTLEMVIYAIRNKIA